MKPDLQDTWKYLRGEYQSIFDKDGLVYKGRILEVVKALFYAFGLRRWI